MAGFSLSRSQKIVLIVLVIGSAAVAAVALNWPRTDALAESLQPIIDQQNTEQSSVARAILTNYEETRSNASKWSGVYWGFTFVAAICSALAGLILKFESIIKNPELKKDIAALLSVGAALLITISTSGDFQRKWQANRVAASELERTGYTFLENKAAEPSKYYFDIGSILHKRNLAIVGNVDQKTSEKDSEKKSQSNQ